MPSVGLGTDVARAGVGGPRGQGHGVGTRGPGRTALLPTTGLGGTPPPVSRGWREDSRGRAGRTRRAVGARRWHVHASAAGRPVLRAWGLPPRSARPPQRPTERLLLAVLAVPDGAFPCLRPGDSEPLGVPLAGPWTPVATGRGKPHGRQASLKIPRPSPCHLVRQHLPPPERHRASRTKDPPLWQTALPRPQ